MLIYCTAYVAACFTKLNTGLVLHGHLPAAPPRQLGFGASLGSRWPAEIGILDEARVYRDLVNPPPVLRPWTVPTQTLRPPPRPRV